MLDRQRETWSQMGLGTDAVGIPIAWAFDGPNRHDIPLLEPTLVSLPDHNLDLYVGRLHLDKGYDARTVRALLETFGADRWGDPAEGVLGEPEGVFDVEAV